VSRRPSRLCPWAQAVPIHTGQPERLTSMESAPIIQGLSRIRSETASEDFSANA